MWRSGLQLSLAVLAMVAGYAFGGERQPMTTWSFKDNAGGWTAQQNARSAAFVEAAAALRIGGDSDITTLNSPGFPLEASRYYVATCRLKPAAADNRLVPVLKCEFLNQKAAMCGARWSNPDDPETDPTGVRISLPFIAPGDVKTARMKIELADPTLSAAAPLLVEQVELRELPRQDWVACRYRLDPVPPPLLQTRGLHPRFLLNPARLAEVRQRAKGPLKRMAEMLMAKADSFGQSKPPAYRLDDKEFPDQQLWQRGVGEAMPVLAMAWLLSGERRYLDYAEEWALASCAYPTWGLGHNNMVELSAGQQLFGLATVYDWGYAELSAPVRQKILQTLVERGARMFDATTGQTWWMGTYLQNHQWVNLNGLSAAAYATWEDNPEAFAWLAVSLNRFQRSLAAFGPDGASIEGPGYWCYGAENLLRFMYPARELLGADLFASPWWKHTASYLLYMTLPRNSWNPNSTMVDLADSNRKNWNGPSDVLWALAAEYGDGRAAWLADQIDMSRYWPALLWDSRCTPPLSPTEAPALPAFKLFADVGIVCARSSWQGDESLVVFKCGHPAGRQERARFHNSDVGHVHPDAGHFDVYGAGEWLIRDDGYRMKFTRQHNTLLIDGAGQSGEGALWLKGAEIPRSGPLPEILETSTSEAVDRIVAEVAPAYPPAAGLRSFRRTLVFAKPDTLLVYDDIRLEAEKDLELDFHPEASPQAFPGYFLCSGKKAVLRIEFAGPGEDVLDRTTLPAHGGYPESSLPGVKRRLHGAKWSSLAVFSWTAAAGAPEKIAIQATGDAFKVEAKGQVFEFKPQ